ncbi:MAG: hypothetical protein JXQ91_07485 [Vannielia sp.]|uniref:hypothetical protein n=1 Tax=Vannielia sp. TaxID=2813045 RepID=UPI003B8CC3E1
MGAAEQLVVDDAWTAAALGMAKSTLQAKRKDLERADFPKRDPLLGGYIKADILAWIETRRKFRDRATLGESTGGGINFDQV